MKNISSVADDKDITTKKYVNDNAYVHPTTSGNKHIPSGGSSGQVLQLRWIRLTQLYKALRKLTLPFLRGQKQKQSQVMKLVELIF